MCTGLEKLSAPGFCRLWGYLVSFSFLLFPPYGILSKTRKRSSIFSWINLHWSLRYNRRESWPLFSILMNLFNLERTTFISMQIINRTEIFNQLFHLIGRYQTSHCYYYTFYYSNKILYLCTHTLSYFNLITAGCWYVHRVCGLSRYLHRNSGKCLALISSWYMTYIRSVYFSILEKEDYEYKIYLLP